MPQNRHQNLYGQQDEQSAPKFNVGKMPISARTYNLYKETYDKRLDKGNEYITEAFAACCEGTLTLKEVFDLVPVETPFCRDHLHAVVYDAMWGLCQQGGRCTPADVWDEIVRQRQDGLFPRNWLVENCLTTYCLRDDVVPLFGEFVRREAAKEVCANELISLYSACHTYGPMPYEISGKLRTLADRLTSLEPVADVDASIAGIGKRLLESWEKDTQAPIPTPWENLNRVLGGGFVPGELVILAARPSIGKTAYAGAMLTQAAKMEYGVMMISREMSDESVLQRLVAADSGINLSSFRQRTLTVQEKAEARASVERLGRLKCEIREKSTAPMTPGEVLRLINLAKFKVDMLIVDYLQLMQPDNPSKSREQDVASMSRAFKDIATKFKIPVLLLAQLNRQSETTGYREPKMSDLRESGAIEQDADIVLLLHAPEDQLLNPCRLQKVIVAKGRNSGTGGAWTLFNRQFGQIYEAEAPVATATDSGNPRRRGL